MNNKDILYKAILKAEKNGYKDHLKYLPVLCNDVSNGEELLKKLFYNVKEKIVFNHEFAKAFWGEKKLKDIDVCIDTSHYWHSIEQFCNRFGSEKLEELRLKGNLVIDIEHFFANYYKDWQYHLQRMVLEEEPIKYLEKFLDENTN